MVLFCSSAVSLVISVLLWNLLGDIKEKEAEKGN